LGIAVSALGSILLVGIQIVRFRVERSHVVVRLSVSEPDFEDRGTARVSAAVFNRGRPAFIDGMYVQIGKESLHIEGEAEEGHELPVDLETGRSYRIGFDLATFDREFREEAGSFGYPVTYTDDDFVNMRLRVTDGEGHDHWASLTKDSKPNVVALIEVRKKRRSDREAKKHEKVDLSSHRGD